MHWYHATGFVLLFIALYCKVSDSLIKRRCEIYKIAGRPLCILAYGCAFVHGFGIPPRVTGVPSNAVISALPLELLLHTALILLPICCMYVRLLVNRSDKAKDWRGWTSLALMLLLTSAVTMYILGPRVMV